MARTVVIAQARMSSSRLPGKVLMTLGGMPVIDHVIARARVSTLADDLWIATTTDSTDDILAAHLEESGVRYVRGSLEDVLARYVQAAEKSQADTIVRLTCDCPLIDPAVIDEVISAFRRESNVDYCSNGLKRTYPIGIDVEVFSREALERAHAKATAAYEREHVTPYLYQHPELFRLRNVEAPQWAYRPELRLTLDEPADFELLQAVVELVPEGAGLEPILHALRVHPEVEEINAAVAHRHIDKPTEW